MSVTQSHLAPSVVRVDRSMRRLIDLISGQIDESVHDVERCRLLIRDAATQMSTSFHALDELMGQHRRETAMAVRLVQSVGTASEYHDGSKSEQKLQDFLLQANDALEKLVAIITGFARENARITNAVQDLIGQLATIFTNVGRVNEFADETTCLAINAAIEAARAGEAGKGFAVVSAEVRKLSTETKSLNEKITDNISEANRLVGLVTDAVGWMGKFDVSLDNAARFKSDLSNLLDNIETLNRNACTSLQNISRQSAQLELHVSSAMRALQFEDIVSQAMSAAMLRLRELTSSLHHAVSETKGKITPEDFVESVVDRLEARLRNKTHMPAEQKSMKEGDSFLF
ncbi:MAG: methyl-accepting chemotaxis protein [Myxococcota bacterium]